METDQSQNYPDADGNADETTRGEVQPKGEDRSGGPLSSGAGPGRGQGDRDVPGGAADGAEDDADAVGGGGERFEG
jgi:hypothetical protein